MKVRTEVNGRGSCVEDIIKPWEGGIFSKDKEQNYRLNLKEIHI